MEIPDFFLSVPRALRIFLILAVAVLLHFAVTGLRRLSQWLLGIRVGRDPEARESFHRRYPRFATLTTIFVSAISFLGYFLAIGLIFQEFNISLKAYLASATVIGLAVGFGLQGFVQDIVIGMTLIFSDVINLGDVAETSGQVGRVESIGLRFTKLVNLHGQQIYIPNRNIAMISRYERGGIFAVAHIQLPEDIGQDILATIQKTARGLHSQNQTIILREPVISDIKTNKEGGWRYVSVRFRLWPGQGSLIENVFKQRIVSQMNTIHKEYADWMVSVAYGLEKSSW